MGLVVVLVVVALCVGGCWATFRGTGVAPGHIAHRGPETAGAVGAVVDGAENEYDRIAAELKEAEKSLGRAAGRRLIARAAWGVLALSALIGVGSVAMLFLGGALGIARGQAITGFMVAGAGLFVGYFITVYGVIVSEVLSWAVIVALGIGGPVVVYTQVRAWLDMRTARALLAKRAAGGESAKDGIQRLPVSRSIKKRLDDAWDTLRMAGAGEASGADVIEARARLEKFGLPVPVVE